MKSLGSSHRDVRSATLASPGSQFATPESAAGNLAVLEFPPPQRPDRAQAHLELEALGSLAGGMAQDLTNIFTPILMSIELLDEQLHDAESRRLLTVVEESARRGVAMVRQILSFSRGLDHPQDAIDLRHLLEDVRRLIAGTFPRSIELVVEIAPGVTHMRADASELHQAIVNLCVNARDAMPGGGRLLLRAEMIDVDDEFASLTPGARAGRYVAIAIDDTGCGMTPAVRERIFEPFFTTKSGGHSSGLGLPTALSIVNAHGGFLTVHSDAGRGTSCRIFLPDAAASAEADGERPAADPPRGRDELILVVDDEASIRSMTAQLLRTYGYRVVATRNGTDAVTELARRPDEVAAVLTDLATPAVDGTWTIRALKTIAPGVKLIAATGLEGTPVVVDDMHGVSAVLPKPYRPESLLLLLRRVLDN